MKEWKQLGIDNLPRDILTGGYEFEMFEKRLATYTKCYWEPIEIIKHIGQQHSQILYSFAYRKKQPKAPTHEEIMTKWWKTGCVWKRVIMCRQGEDSLYYYLKDERGGVAKKWFIGLESADIPPEAE